MAHVQGGEKPISYYYVSNKVMRRELRAKHIRYNGGQEKSAIRAKTLADFPQTPTNTGKLS